MTASELSKVINRAGNMAVAVGSGSLRIPVRVLDARVVFARLDYLVSPINGDGQVWVEGNRVVLLERG